MSAPERERKKEREICDASKSVRRWRKRMVRGVSRVRSRSEKIRWKADKTGESARPRPLARGKKKRWEERETHADRRWATSANGVARHALNDAFPR